VHLGKGDDFVVAEHAERVIKAGSADLGGEPLSPCCAEQGPAKFQLPLPVDHGQAEPTAPTRVPSERRWAIHFPARSACNCRAISRPRLPPVSATRHRTSRRRRGRCAPGKDRSRALDRQGPIPTGAFRSQPHPIVNWVAISREASRSRRFNGPQPNPEFRLQKSSARAARCKPTG